MLEEELVQYVILPGPVGGSNEVSNDAYRWTHGDTLVFLDLYDEYRTQVGTLRVKSLKRMFEEISKELKIKTGKNISPCNCENRWRVLERAYKKYILNMNKTGSARKDFEYSEVMHKILGKKKNIHPELVLSSENVDVLVETGSTSNETEAVLSNDVEITPKRHASKITPTPKKEYWSKILKCQILREIRLDRQRYYAQRLAQEDKKIEQKIKKNKLLEERNDILRNQ